MFGRKMSHKSSKSCISCDVEFQKLSHNFPVSLLRGDIVMQKSGGHGCDDMTTKTVSEQSILFNVLVKGCALFTCD